MSDSTNQLWNAYNHLAPNKPELTENDEKFIEAFGRDFGYTSQEVEYLKQGKPIPVGGLPISLPANPQPTVDPKLDPARFEGYDTTSLKLWLMYSDPSEEPLVSQLKLEAARRANIAIAELETDGKIINRERIYKRIQDETLNQVLTEVSQGEFILYDRTNAKGKADLLIPPGAKTLGELEREAKELREETKQLPSREEMYAEIERMTETAFDKVVAQIMEKINNGGK